MERDRQAYRDTDRQRDKRRRAAGAIVRALIRQNISIRGSLEIDENFFSTRVTVYPISISLREDLCTETIRKRTNNYALGIFFMKDHFLSLSVSVSLSISLGSNKIKLDHYSI